MKRISLYLLIFTMLYCLCACGKNFDAKSNSREDDGRKEQKIIISSIQVASNTKVMRAKVFLPNAKSLEGTNYWLGGLDTTSKVDVIDTGVSTSVIIRKLGTLKDLLPEHGPTRDDVMVWAKEQARIETLKYKREKEEKQIKLTFHADRPLDYDKQVFYRGGYLFLQSIYYQLQINKICRKLKQKHKFKYDINAILSDMIYARILEPRSKRSSYKAASEFLEKPSYKLHDVYRALDVLGAECDLIQAELYKNSHFLGARNDKVLYYDCSNYYFEIEQEDGNKKYGKSKEHRPNPIIQMGLFMDGDGIPLAFSTFAGNANEQTSLKPLEKKILGEFGCQKFIYCSDAGLGSESIREYNHMGERAYIVTQSIKKLKKEEKEWALDPQGLC